MPAAYTAGVTIIKMLDTWKNKIINGYSKDPKWSGIIYIIRNNQTSLCLIRLPYKLQDGLLYSLPSTDMDTDRLCIPITCMHNALQSAHNNAGHPGLARTIKNLRGMTILKLTKIV
jgi:hypothetical protein